MVLDCYLLAKKHILFLEPDSEKSDIDCYPIIPKLREHLKRWLGIDANDWPVVVPTHVLQADRSSCGAFICYYLKSLAEDLQADLTVKRSAVKIRKMVLDAVIGNCDIYASGKNCKACASGAGSKDLWKWVLLISYHIL